MILKIPKGGIQSDVFGLDPDPAGLSLQIREDPGCGVDLGDRERNGWPAKDHCVFSEKNDFARCFSKDNGHASSGL